MPLVLCKRMKVIYSLIQTAVVVVDIGRSRLSIRLSIRVHTFSNLPSLTRYLLPVVCTYARKKKKRYNRDRSEMKAQRE